MERGATIDAEAAAGRGGLRLALASALCLAGAGLLLWWREGDDIFARLATAALAWCF